MNINLSGRIDANNASEVETEITRKLAESAGEVPVFDASELEYISSARLRVLLKFRKQFGRNLDVINASSEVYDIFEVTGFTELLNVKKKLRSVSVEDCPVIGGGVSSTVYRLDPETIIKVYDKGYDVMPNNPEKIAKDQRTAREVFLHDIPTAISYDMVRVGENFGIVYEMIDSDTLSGTIRKHPERLEELSLKTAQLMRKMHTTEFEPDILPDARLRNLKAVNLLHDGGFISAQDRDLLLAMVNDVPYRNTFIHGDFHPNNIMVRDGELVLIDVGDAALGGPVFDLAISYEHFVRMSRFVAERGSDVQEKAMGLDYKTLGIMWDIIMPEYLGREYTERDEKLLKDYSSIFMMAVIGLMGKVPADRAKVIIEEIMSPLR